MKEAKTNERYPLSITNLAALSFALVLLAGTAMAQSAAETAGAESPQAPSKTFFESIDVNVVNVVNVDVVVTDRQGNLVTDLTADDFEVFEDGEPVPLTSFFAVDGGPAAAGSSDPSAPTTVGERTTTEPVKLVAFVDGLHLTPQGRNRLLPAFREFVGEGAAFDQVMIVGFDSELKIYQDFTDDPQAMLGSLDDVASTVSRGIEAAVSFRSILRLLVEGTVENPSSPILRRDRSDSVARTSLGDIEQFAELRHQENLRSIAAMKESISWLAAVPGRKAMVYFGEGLTVRPAEALLDAWRNRWEGDEDVRVSPRQSVLRYDLGSELRELADFANTNRVTIYAVGSESSIKQSSSVEFSGLSGSGGRQGRIWTPAQEALEAGNMRESLQLMTEPTGGASRVVNAGALLDQVRSDFASYYSLAYTPSRGRDEERHKIRVEVARPDLRLRYRDQYKEKPSFERMQDRTKSALVLAESDNPLEVAIDFGTAETEEGGKLLLPVIVKIPMSKLTLLPHQRFHEGRVSIYLGTRDDKGRVSAVQRTAVPIRIPNEQLLAALSQLGGYSVTLRIRPIDHMVAVAVRDEIGHIDSSVSQRFEPET